MATLLPITLSTAAGAALLSAWLGARVVQMRRRHKVALGDGGVPEVVAGIVGTLTLRCGLALFAITLAAMGQ